MKLLDLVVEYRTIRPLSSGAAYLMRRTAVLYGCFLSRDATTDDLTDLSVSQWLEWMESRQKPATRAGNRTRMLCLWRFAARRGLASSPGEVRRCPVPDPMPRAWTVEQVSALLAACDNLNLRAAAWFRAAISVAWETGLRRSDLERLHRDQFEPGATTLAVRQHKTAQPHVVAIREETRRLVAALPGEHPLRSPWCAGRLAEYWFRLRLWSGVGNGGLQQIRRSGATAVAREHGLDAASEFLGHRSREMLDYYVDRRLVRREPWLPPRAAG